METWKSQNEIEEAKFCIIFFIIWCSHREIVEYFCAVIIKIAYIASRGISSISILLSLSFFGLYCWVFNFLCWSSQYLFYIFFIVIAERYFFSSLVVSNERQLPVRKKMIVHTYANFFFQLQEKIPRENKWFF